MVAERKDAARDAGTGAGWRAGGTPAGRSRFDLAHLPLRTTFTVEEAGDRDIPEAIAFAGRYFPHVEGGQAAVWRVHRRSRSILVARGAQGIVGTAAFLRLNPHGLERLRADALAIADPDEALLAGPGERAAAIYAWLLCLPGASVSAMGQVMRWLRHAGLARCDLYARPGSPAGERFMRKTGFHATDASLAGQPLWIYPRAPSPPTSRKD